MTWNKDEPHLDILQNIESGLKILYEKHITATDAQIILTLGKARIAVKQLYGYGKSQNGNPENELEIDVIHLVVSIGKFRIEKIKDVSLDTFDKHISKIIRSIDTHRIYGILGYYEFIKKFV